MYARFTIKPAKSNLSFLIKILRSNSNKTLKDIDIYKLRSNAAANKYEELQESLLRNIHDIFYLASIIFVLTFV